MRFRTLILRTAPCIIRPNQPRSSYQIDVLQKIVSKPTLILFRHCMKCGRFTHTVDKMEARMTCTCTGKARTTCEGLSLPCCAKDHLQHGPQVASHKVVPVLPKHQTSRYLGGHSSVSSPQPSDYPGHLCSLPPCTAHDVSNNGRHRCSNAQEGNFCPTDLSASFRGC